MLAGKGPTATVKLYPASRLPKDPAQRFAILFAEQPRWEASELEPYIASLKVRPPFLTQTGEGSRGGGISVPQRSNFIHASRVELRMPLLHVSLLSCAAQVPGLSMGALLLKYARASQPTPDSPVTYSAR